MMPVYYIRNTFYFNSEGTRSSLVFDDILLFVSLLFEKALCSQLPWKRINIAFKERSLLKTTLLAFFFQEKKAMNQKVKNKPHKKEQIEENRNGRICH